MKIIVLADKISGFKAVAPCVAALHPPGTAIVGCIVNLYKLLGVQFVFPRGLSLRDYPYAKSPDYRPLVPYGSSSSFGWHTAEHIDGVGWVTLPISQNAHGGHGDHFATADRILVTMDPRPPSAFMARLALDQSLPGGHADPRVGAAYVDTWYMPDMTRAMAAAGTFDDVLGDLARQGAVRQRFDYNYAMNANVILRPIQQSCGMAADAAPLSKYAVQTLYACRDLKQGVSEGELISIMSGWKGTGKYAKLAHLLALGSPSSQGPIVQGLRDSGLIKTTSSEEAKDRNGTFVRRLLGISDLGSKVLDSLHPDCEDPDLPFRIDAWSRLPVAEANAKVDRYIRTFFGKMGRYARRHEAATGARALMPA